MRRRILTLTLAVLGIWVHQLALAGDELCVSLRKFVESVRPNESKVLAFHTSWGSGFKGSDDELALYAKRCDHGGYDPAKAVCAYLMEHGAVEFSGNDAKKVVMCLSRNTHFADRLELHRVELSLTYGTDNRGSIIDIKFVPDEQLGGMVLSITADGY